jgi:CubicO group peptidase (beta-lactamase class C family)
VSVTNSLAEKQNLGSVGEFGWGGAAGTNAWVDPLEQMISIVMFQVKPAKVGMLDHRIKVGLTAAVMG